MPVDCLRLLERLHAGNIHAQRIDSLDQFREAAGPAPRVTGRHGVNLRGHDVLASTTLSFRTRGGLAVSWALSLSIASWLAAFSLSGCEITFSTLVSFIPAALSGAPAPPHRAVTSGRAVC